MIIDFKKNDTKVTFVITDYERHEEALKMCYYQKEGDAYVKSFSSDIPNLERIMQHYKEHAEEMFSQLIYLSPIPWEEALEVFAKRVEGSGIRWWLVGSCAACIRGIPMNPHDVDIMMDSKDVDKINALFADYIIEPIVDTNGWLTKDFGVLFWHGRIDIATDPVASLDEPVPVDCGPYGREHLEEVIWRGHTILVPPIDLMINANRLRGRMERVDMLESYLTHCKK